MIKYAYRHCIVVFLVLFCIPLLLTAAVSATYTAESPLLLELAPGIFTHQSVIGIKLGTFYISNPDRLMYSPALLSTNEVGGNVVLSGLYKNWSGGVSTIRNLNFKIMSVAYPYGDGGGGAPVLRTVYGGRAPLVEWNGTTVSANPFIVELYLVNTNSDNYNAAANLGTDGRLYSLDTPYLIPAGFNPVFSLAMAQGPNSGVGDYASGDGEAVNNNGSYITTNGNAGPNVTPILNPGSFTSNPEDGDGFFYGDAPLVPTFFFNFLQPTASFSLSSAIGIGRVVVNQARIEVQNGVAGVTYSQKLTFSDTSTDTDFQLFPVGVPGLPLSYQLFLGTEPITKGVFVTWASLVPGVNSRDLSIGGIVANNVASLASGNYQGTISVTITNPN